jgi:hypothetical protein
MRPFCYEAIIFMADQNLGRMSVLLGEFNGGRYGLLLGIECRFDMAVSGTNLPIAIVFQHNVSRSMQCFLHCRCDIFTTTQAAPLSSSCIATRMETCRQGAILGKFWGQKLTAFHSVHGIFETMARIAANTSRLIRTNDAVRLRSYVWTR